MLRLLITPLDINKSIPVFKKWPLTKPSIGMTICPTILFSAGPELSTVGSVLYR